jgi:DoxX-like family
MLRAYNGTGAMSDGDRLRTWSAEAHSKEEEANVMNKLLWVLQVALALAFLAHGLLLLFPPADVAAQMNATLPRWFTFFLGVAEVAAAFGLTLPGWTGVQPWLVPSAAFGIMIVMVSATAYHLQRGEISSAAVTMVLLVMSTAVAFLRWRVLPIQSRATQAVAA